MWEDDVWRARIFLNYLPTFMGTCLGLNTFYSDVKYASWGVNTCIIAEKEKN